MNYVLQKPIVPVDLYKAVRDSRLVVAAVADGLKAWKLLKGRPQNVDLILTEVELPSISGFALLTLITEHYVCKNIPVISKMMRATKMMRMMRATKMMRMKKRWMQMR